MLGKVVTRLSVVSSISYRAELLLSSTLHGVNDFLQLYLV
jgi:hypothetical protein